MIVVCFRVQGEDVIKHTNGKYHVFTFYNAKRKTFLRILMSSVVCVISNTLTLKYLTVQRLL